MLHLMSKKLRVMNIHDRPSEICNWAVARHLLDTSEGASTLTPPLPEVLDPASLKLTAPNVDVALLPKSSCRPHSTGRTPS